jgi:hypothetical protein
MATLFPIALLLVSPLAIADAPPPEAWSAARFGMTPEEVLAALPKQAFRLSPEVNLPNGKVVAAGIDGFEFEGLTFDVRFVFSGGKLAMVSLRTPASSRVDVAEYERLAKSLAARWGKPLESAADDKVIDMRQTRWNRGPDRADLKYIPGVVVLIHYPRPPG